MDPHTRESRGFGFVDMATVEDADKAIDALHDSEFKGRIIRVEKVRFSHMFFLVQLDCAIWLLLLLLSNIDTLLFLTV